MTRYEVTFQIDVADDTSSYVEKGETKSRFGLIQFTRDCPPTFHNANKRQTRHAEESNYRVISCGTRPLQEVQTSTGGMEYMEPALARNRHTTEGTMDDERITYSVPVDCVRWLDRFLERQGYEAWPMDRDMPGPVTDRIVISRPEADVRREMALEAEIGEQP